jgi:hypothetical protein
MDSVFDLKEGISELSGAGDMGWQEAGRGGGGADESLEVGRGGF